MVSNCWTYNPREHPEHPIRPFITYPFQDHALVEIDAAIGRHHLFLPKSRYVGATWVVLIPCFRRLLFRRMQSFALVSRTEDMVDKKGDPDSLFWKLDFIASHLPPWMTQALDRYKLSYANQANGSSIMGTSTTGNMVRGGRKTGIIPDEFAFVDPNEAKRAWPSISGATSSVIMPSTPNGMGNEFHRLCSEPHRKKIYLRWQDHPLQIAGEYGTDAKGELNLVDKEYWEWATVGTMRHKYGEIDISGEDHELALRRYPFILDGKQRSPYYDNESLKLGLNSLIAQELDIDFLGSGVPFFSHTEIEQVVHQYAVEPFARGTMIWDEVSYEPEEFAPAKDGELLLWLNLIGGKPPVDRRYIMGADISQGTGASSSCLTVADRLTCEKVARLATAHLRPERFAEYAFALGKWFNRALIIFEMQGPGENFDGRLTDLRYGNLYHHKSPSGTMSRKPGWPSTEYGKQSLLNRYGYALVRGKFINRDKEAVRECLQYRFNSQGKVEHSRAAGLADPSGAKKNHGDMVIADALTCYALRVDSGKSLTENEKPERIPDFCYAARMIEAEEAMRKRDEW